MSSHAWDTPALPTWTGSPGTMTPGAPGGVLMLIFDSRCTVRSRRIPAGEPGCGCARCPCPQLPAGFSHAVHHAAQFVPLADIAMAALVLTFGSRQLFALMMPLPKCTPLI